MTCIWLPAWHPSKEKDQFSEGLCCPCWPLPQAVAVCITTAQRQGATLSVLKGENVFQIKSKWNQTLNFSCFENAQSPDHFLLQLFLPTFCNSYFLFTFNTTSFSACWHTSLTLQSPAYYPWTGAACLGSSSSQFLLWLQRFSAQCPPIRVKIDSWFQGTGSQRYTVHQVKPW